MKKFIDIVLMVFVLFGSMIGFAEAIPHHYEIIDLGVGCARAINNQGQVIVGRNFGDQLLYDNGEIVNTGLYLANAINNNGVVVGKTDQGHLGIYSDGNLQEVFLGGHSTGIDINDVGQIIVSQVISAQYKINLYENGESTFIASGTSSSYINNSGEIFVGSESGIYNVAGFNDSGNFIGWDHGVGTYFYGDEKEYIDGGTWDSVAGINNLDQVIGSGEFSESGGQQIPFIWEDGDRYNLTELVDLGDWLQITGVRDINDVGQICGYGNLGGANHAFILNPYDEYGNPWSTEMGSWAGDIGPNPAPVPEPATMLLLGTGLAGLGIWKKRKVS